MFTNVNSTCPAGRTCSTFAFVVCKLGCLSTTSLSHVARETLTDQRFMHILDNLALPSGLLLCNLISSTRDFVFGQLNAYLSVHHFKFMNEGRKITSIISCSSSCCSWIFMSTCVFKGKFTLEGCNMVQGIDEYKTDLPQDEE